MVVDAPRTPPARPPQQDPATVIKNFEHALFSVTRTPHPPRSLSRSPTKQMFLTKESRLTNFAAWDVDERLQDLDTQFRQMKDVMNSTLTERKGLDEALELAKTRGK